MVSSRKKYILAIFVAVFLFGLGLITSNKFFFSRNSLYGNTNSTNSDKGINPEDENYFKYSRMFSETYHLLKREFVNRNKVTAKNLFYGAISGMLSSLDDPFSTFMEPSITKEFDIDMNAKFGGLGIRIDIRDNWLTVISPIEDTPAWRAGLKPNDKIIEIEGKTTKGITVQDAVEKLRGKPGTEANITILRDGMEPFKISIVRDEIVLKTVKSDIIPYRGKKVAYIKINEFSVPTADEFSSHLEENVKKKPDAMIIDLRNNPGGLLSVVVNCVDKFLDKGLIVYTRGRLAENNSDYYSTQASTIVPKDMPLVVLVNQGSASASEIFAGAIKDTHRGVLVGMKTFGKGSVQKTFAFPEDGSMVKYTVAKYYTPSGFVLDQVGLQPDVEEKLWFEKISDEEKRMVVKLQTTNIVKNFLKATPRPSDEQLKALRTELDGKGIPLSFKSLKWLVDSKLSESQMPKLYDLEYDEQLSKALDIVNNYNEYKKTVVYYEEAKN